MVPFDGLVKHILFAVELLAHSSSRESVKSGMPTDLMLVRLQLYRANGS